MCLWRWWTYFSVSPCSLFYTSMDHANELEDLPLSLPDPGRCLGAITESITWYFTGKRFSRFYRKWAWLVVFHSAAHTCKWSTNMFILKWTFCGYHGCINVEQFNAALKTLKNFTHKAWQTLGVQTDKTWFYEWFFFSALWEHKKYSQPRDGLGILYKYWRICIEYWRQFHHVWILKG